MQKFGRKKFLSAEENPQKVELLSEPVYFKLVVNNIASLFREGTGAITHPLVIEALSLARIRAAEHHGLEKMVTYRGDKFGNHLTVRTSIHHPHTENMASHLLTKYIT